MRQAIAFLLVQLTVGSLEPMDCTAEVVDLVLTQQLAQQLQALLLGLGFRVDQLDAAVASFSGG